MEEEEEDRKSYVTTSAKKDVVARKKILNRPKGRRTCAVMPEWELIGATSGRPYKIMLPADLTAEQVAWIRARLPTRWSLTQVGDPRDQRSTPTHIPTEAEFEHQRTLLVAHGKLRVEVLELEERKAALNLELAKLERFLAQRRQRARSLSSALAEVIGDLKIPNMEGGNGGGGKGTGGA